MKKTKPSTEIQVPPIFTLEQAIEQFNQLIKRGLAPEMVKGILDNVSAHPVSLGMAYKLDEENKLLIATITLSKMNEKEEDKKDKLIIMK